MGRSAFDVDISGALDGLAELNRGSSEAVNTGIGRALLQVKTDMITQRPTAPIKEGFLRGSTSIHVQGTEVSVPLGPRERSDKKVTGNPVPKQEGKVIGVIGVNVPYAARWHEVPAHFSEPSAGNKYLESKMANNKNTYMKIVENAIREFLNKGKK